MRPNTEHVFKDSTTLLYSRPTVATSSKMVGIIDLHGPLCFRFFTDQNTRVIVLDHSTTPAFPGWRIPLLLRDRRLKSAHRSGFWCSRWISIDGIGRRAPVSTESATRDTGCIADELRSQSFLFTCFVCL